MKTKDEKRAVIVRKVGKRFRSGNGYIEALKEVDIEAYRGEILLLVGPSGCGKTTLLSVIAGTLKVEEGEIEVMGKPVHRMSPAALTRWRGRAIGFIFQQFNLIPTLNVAENVAVPLFILKQRNPIKKAREMLETVGLGDRWMESPNKLSGGQQQRVAIARALIHEPPLVICDEPTAALDAKSGEVVMNLFRQVARDRERAVIIVTHDNRITSYGDRIAHMDDGRIVEVHHRPPDTHAHFDHETIH